MLTCVAEVEVSDTKGYDLEVLPSELGRHGELLPAAPPTTAFYILSHDGWMV